MPKLKLWGFNGSTYVRTVRMLLAEKGVSDYEQAPLNVLEGEPRKPDHLERHAFGKVPVVDVDGFRIIETAAIARYLDAVLPGPKLVPADPKAMARSAMVEGVVDSYGYMPLVMTAGYHLFPDFIGGKDDAKHVEAIKGAKLAVSEIMKIRGSDTFVAGKEIALGDLFLAPIIAYVTMTPHKDEFLGLSGMSDWWAAVTARESFTSTAP